MGVQQKLRGVALGAILSSGVQRLEMRLREAVRALRGRPRQIDIYVRADDPYSYLLAQLARDLQRTYSIDVRWVPLGAPGRDVEPEPELRARYAVRDCRQLARYCEIDFPAAGPDVLEPRWVDRANRVWAAADPGDTALVAEVGRALWSGDEIALARLESSAGRRDAGETAAVLEANLREARARGHYQGAMMYVDGLWAWGPDRLHVIERALGGPAATPLFHRRATPVAEPADPRADPSRLEMFFSFRSPYSYLALEQTFAAVDRLGVQLVVRPVLPMVMRGMKVPFAKRFYIARDAMREARRLEIPYGRICDPLGAGVERCLALFERAERAGRAREFLLSAGRGIWAEALDTADDGDLAHIAERAGLDVNVAEAVADDSWRERAEANRAALLARGLWGVPSYATGDFSCWGQDRIWMVAEKLREARGYFPSSQASTSPASAT